LTFNIKNAIINIEINTFLGGLTMRRYIPMTEVFTLHCGDILIPLDPNQPKRKITEIESYGAEGGKNLKITADLLDDSGGDYKFFRERPGQPIREMTTGFKQFSGIEREENPSL
jgi:hypothetical protein